MAMLRGPSHCPLLMAALVAACGVALIIFGTLRPTGSGGEAPDGLPMEQLYGQHLHALTELSRGGLSGLVSVVDFGDALGLGVTKSVAAGTVLFEVPETLALDPAAPRSCDVAVPGAELQDAGVDATDAIAPSLECVVELRVSKALASNEATRMTALTALLVLERRRGLGLGDGLEKSAASATLGVLPEISWQAENGLFSIDEEEFRLFSLGTSMEGWQQAAINETQRAHDFITRVVAPMLGDDAVISLDEVRWAFLVLQANAQWVKDDSSDDIAKFPEAALFLFPLLLARPTPEWQHGVELRHDTERRVYQVVTPRALRSRDEIHFVDRRLSDASALCFRGLQLVGQHRARLQLDVSAIERDPLSQPILDAYGCGAQPLVLYVESKKAVDPLLLSCMRMLTMASNASRLERVTKSKWTKTWPETKLTSRKIEARATDLGLGFLQQALARLGSTNAEIRQRFGRDAVGARPTVKVREAETMILVGLLKSMKELQLVSGNEYLFDALRDTQQD